MTDFRQAAEALLSEVVRAYNRHGHEAGLQAAERQIKAQRAEECEAIHAMIQEQYHTWEYHHGIEDLLDWLSDRARALKG